MSQFHDATLIGPASTLRDAMVSLDQSAEGVTFVVEGEGVLLGLLTDGDIRRALLGGASMEATAAEHMNRLFVSGSNLARTEDNLLMLSDRIRVLPVLDSAGRIVDMLRWKNLYRLPVMEPVLEGREFEYVADCLATNWISSQGQYVDRFQDAFRDFLQTSHALCVTNGTAALHLAMAALHIGPGDEVIIPDLTFVSPASMAILCGARPVFVDVSRATWTIDPAAIEERITSRTRAIVVVHLYGQPCDMDPIMATARRHGLYVIEDCAEALGAEYKGRKVGTMGDVGTFSFFANKVITTGEGGMVTTANDELCHTMKVLRDHGTSPGRRYWHDVAGFNYRLTNLQAAVGLAQLEQIDGFLEHRRQVVARYSAGLGSIPGLTLPPSFEWAKNIHWLYSVVIDENAAGITRDKLMSSLSTRGIETRPFFHPLHEQPPFADETHRSFPHAEWLAARGLSLPTSNNVTLSDVDMVCDAIRSITCSAAMLAAAAAGGMAKATGLSATGPNST